MKWHQRLQPTRLIDRLRDRLPSPADRPPTDPAQPEVVDVPPTRIEERVASVNRQLQRNMRELREVVIASPAAPILAERYEQLRGTLEPLAPELQGRLRAVSDHLQGLLQWQSTSELAAAQKPRYPDPLRKLVERAQENPLLQQGLQQLQTVTEPLKKPAAATLLRYHQWVHDHIDPLAGRERYEQLRALSGGSAEHLSAVQKSANELMAWGITGAGLTALAAAAGIPIGSVSLLFGLVLLGPGIQIAYQKAVEERTFSYVHLGLIYGLGFYASGFLSLGAVTLLAGSIAYKFGAISEATLRHGMVSIFGQQPRTVWRLVNGVETETPFEEVERGDLLVCDAGQVIPVDGVVVQGTAAVDQHMLTGESQPAEKGVGDTVLAATVVLSGRILVEVHEAGAATTVARIGEILNRSSTYRLSLEEKATVIADRTLPVMLTGSGLALLTAGPVGAVAMIGTNFTLNMIGVVPFTLLKFLNHSAHAGILVKEGEVLERLRSVDTVVFDKTGTLTLEQPQVVAIYPCGPLTGTEILRITAAAEQRQSHPIARAILAAAAERHLELPTMLEARYEIGYGLTVQLPTARGSTEQIHVGSARFMALEGIALPEELQPIAADCRERGTALVWVARDGVMVGALELEATIRPETQALVAALKQRGMEIFIISGDQEAPTRHLAALLGMDGYFANTLPDEKASLVKELQEKGRKVCFVGDGINDAIALRQADVSVSMAGATTAAIDTAQVVLMGGDLGRILTLIELVDSMHANLDQNYKTSIALSLLAASGVLFLHAGFLATEVIYVASVAAAVAIANKKIPTTSPQSLQVPHGEKRSSR